jgi:hypothetical protein
MSATDITRADPAARHAVKECAYERCEFPGTDGAEWEPCTRWDVEKAVGDVVMRALLAGRIASVTSMRGITYRRAMAGR